MLSRDYDLTLFFSNSNVSPRAEYDRRLLAARTLAVACGLVLVEDDYDHAAWRRTVRGLETEPEGGRRCARCFAFNLERASSYARVHGFDLFTTTLTISPHKRSETIFEAGRALGDFAAIDLKKRDGFRKSVELSKRYGLYRQDYCGCEFSRRQAS
jgi:predicted adenine nucleotide alpha hydrolase (AANH) superfamily ATPase